VSAGRSRKARKPGGQRRDDPEVAFIEREDPVGAVAVGQDDADRVNEVQLEVRVLRAYVMCRDQVGRAQIGELVAGDWRACT
jgi:hypothetical protein